VFIHYIFVASVAGNPTVVGVFHLPAGWSAAHRARETVELLKVRAVELLKEVTPDFIQPSLWPPNSPDPNPVDYAIWRIMQERVYNKGNIANVEELRLRIVDEWERLDQRIIDGAVKEWRKRLRACAAAERGQFEHEL